MIFLPEPVFTALTKQPYDSSSNLPLMFPIRSMLKYQGFHEGIVHRTFSYVATSIMEVLFNEFLFGAYRYKTPEGSFARSRIHDDFYVADLVPGLKESK